MAAANKDPVEDQILQTLKTLKVGRANEKLAKIFMHFGTSPIEILKMNSYMMSALADQNKINKIHGDSLNEYVSLLVETADNGKGYKMIDPNKRTKDKNGKYKNYVFNDKMKEKITEERYNYVWQMVADSTTAFSNRKVSARTHSYKTAIQYMKVWAHFVSWSCDFDYSTKLSLEQVNSLLKITEDKLRPMFEKVKNGQNKDLGIRNFTTVHDKYQGSVEEKLDQVLIEY